MTVLAITTFAVEIDLMSLFLSRYVGTFNYLIKLSISLVVYVNPNTHDRENCIINTGPMNANG